MVQSWGPLATVCAVLLLLSGSSWPRPSTSSLASTAKTLVDPTSATYEGFDPSRASLKLVQVVFRHGARTPLNTIYSFEGSNWTHCRDHYQGVEVELHDENGGKQAPPIIDEDEPVLPGGCRQGTLTEAGYGLALDLGAQLRSRYVEGGSGPTAGFVPDLGAPGAGSQGRLVDWDSEVASLRTTPIRRTVATLRGVLTGLWPRLAEATGGAAAAVAGRQQQRRGLRAAPVLPVAASLEPLEIMYGNNRTCARLGPLHAAMQQDLDAADARDAELPRLNRLVAEALGFDPSKAIVWPKLYDTLAAMIADGLPLPPGATQDVLDIIWAQAERHEAAIIGPGVDLCRALGPGSGPGGGDDGSAESAIARMRRCHEVLRLGIGMLVRRLLDNMERHVSAAASAGALARRGAGARMRRQEREPEPGVQQQEATSGVAAEAEGAGVAALPPPSRLYLFSGHDSTVTPLLAVLGQPARAWPPFTANLIFELWQAGGGGGASGKAATAVGRRAMRADRRAGSGFGSADAEASDPEFWVRILYNGSPLVVPKISNTGGWAPLGILRQRVLLPYAIGQAEHTAVCAKEDISDLADPQAPSPSRALGRLVDAGAIRGAGFGAAVSQAVGGEGASLGGGADRRSALAAREQEIRHAML